MTWFIAIHLLEMDLIDLIIDSLKKPGGYLTEEGVDMDYGVHLPLIAFDGEPFTPVVSRSIPGPPNVIASMFMYVTCDGKKAKQMLCDVISPILRRTERELENRLLIGSPNGWAEKLSAFKPAGAQRVFLRPVADELRQLELFMEKVEPLVQV
jgi:hypothetical protein